MKELRLTFEEKEFKKIKKVKELSGDSWHDWIISLVEWSRENERRI